MIASWLANKLAAPILLALCVAIGIGLAVQTVRLNGVSFFGFYAIDGYKPMYAAVVAKDAADDIARSKAALKLAQDQQKAMADNDAKWAAIVAQMSKNLETLQGKVPVYVTKEIATACVPVGLAMLLDAAGTGVNLPEVSAEAAKSLSACSNLSVSDAAAKLVWNLSIIPEDTARLENAGSAWQAQYELTNGDGDSHD